MNAKDFLMRPTQLDCNMKMIATDILVLRCQAEKINAVLSPVVGGKGANKDFSAVVDRIIEENKTLVQIAGEINYTEQYVRKLHSDSINEVQEILDKKEEH